MCVCVCVCDTRGCPQVRNLTRTVILISVVAVALLGAILGVGVVANEVSKGACLRAVARPRGVVCCARAYVRTYARSD